MPEQKKFAMMSATNGHKIMARKERIRHDLQNYLERGMVDSEKEMFHICNKALYELAEQQGKSLWDLCFQVVPRWEPVEDDIINNAQISYALKLIPLLIDFEHGPEYWEMKYRRLKEAIQKLIDEKED